MKLKITRPKTGAPPAPEGRIKIYFLPNLMTASNLFCGFVALTKIVEADISTGNFMDVKVALLFILLACIFDFLDGRVARLGGSESPFGREFDSLADLISFGVAPAFLVHRIVLKDVFVRHPEIGWFIASIYLICGACKGEVGLDQHETRTWPGWHHHLRHAFLAQLFLIHLRVHWSGRAALTTAHARLLIAQAIDEEAWPLRNVSALIAYRQSRNHAAYRSHRKETLKRLRQQAPARKRKTS